MLENKEQKNFVIIDVGCGNGYTISQISDKFQNVKIIGIEKNDDLRNIALDRFKHNDNVEIKSGDVLKELPKIEADIVYCQRVVINLLSKLDQQQAYQNIGHLVKNGGIFFCLECMEKPLRNLNEARKEYDLEPISASFHNLYMNENIFTNLGCFEIWENDRLPHKNFLSTHYYVSRVLHDITLNGKNFIRNSHFVSFMSEALKQNIGEYSPIQFFAFKKIVYNKRLYKT